MTHTADANVIRQSVVGVEMSNEECKALARLMQVLALEDGDVLVREGDVNIHLHLLAQGRIRAENRLDQAQNILYEMRIGELAGTRAFVDGASRRATMRTFGGATVYALAPADSVRTTSWDWQLIQR